MATNNIKPGYYVVYINGDIVELGKVKSVRGDHAFVWYHEGDTASCTPLDKLLPLENAYTIQQTSLGGRVACSLHGPLYTLFSGRGFADKVANQLAFEALDEIESVIEDILEGRHD